MGKLMEHLMRCAVCGAVPKIKDTYEIDPSEGHDYKLVCSQCSLNNGCGNWFKNKYKACLDWNRRQTKAPKVTAHLATIAWIDVNPRRTIMTAPCKNCPEREIGCHSMCDRYIRYAKQREKIREKRMQEQLADPTVFLSESAKKVKWDLYKKRRK